MKQWDARAFSATILVVTVTGIAYFFMKYLMDSGDPFAVINHPWEPVMLAAHVLAAPLTILAFGMLFRSHVLKKLRSRRRSARRSGWMSLSSFTVMALSGYLLQVLSDPAWLRIAVWIHVVSSVAFVVAYGAHLVLGWLAERSTERRRPLVLSRTSPR